MTFSPQQKAQLSAWLHEGISLSDIQKRISSEMGIGMTYMELRFLIDDLELDVVDPKAAEPEPEAEAEAEAEPAIADEGEFPEEMVAAVEEAEAVAEEPEIAEGAISVTIDALQRPGAMVSGEVTFSDGETLGWQLDQIGRLGLIPGSETPEGYQPPPEDIAEFQTELQRQLQSKGF